MSSFSEIATNLDQRLTALETYFNSLTAKGCPRDCAPKLPNVGVKITGNSCTKHTIWFTAYNQSGGVGDVIAVQFQSLTSSKQWVTTGEYSVDSSTTSLSGVSLSSYPTPQPNHVTLDMCSVKGRWKNAVGWGEWGEIYACPSSF